MPKSICRKQKVCAANNSADEARPCTGASPAADCDRTQPLSECLFLDSGQVGDPPHTLQQPEVDFNGRGHGHRFAVPVAGLELPLAYGLQGLLVQPQP